MSHSSSKISSNQPKFQRTPFGVKVIGLDVREPSPSLMSFGTGVLNDEPIVETCVSGESSAVSEKSSSVAMKNVVDNIADSGLQIVKYAPFNPFKVFHPVPLTTVYPVPDSPEPVNVVSEVNVDVNENIVGGVSSDATVSEEVHLKGKMSSTKSPVPDSGSHIDIPSGGESSENEPLASIARKMRKRMRGSADEIPSSSVKKAKGVSGSSKSKKSLNKGKKMFVGSSSKKRSSERIKSAYVSSVKKGKAPMVEEVVELDVEDIQTPVKKMKSVMISGTKKGKASRVEADVEQNVQDIRSSERRKKSVTKHVNPDVKDSRSVKKKKLNSKGETSVSIYFHSSESRDKWPFVSKRRISIERAIGSDVKECAEIIDIIEKAGLIKSVSRFGKCYEHLVKEFIANLSSHVGIPGCEEFRRVCVRNRVVVFSPGIINSALDRTEMEFEDEELCMNLVAEVLTAGQVKTWPPKKLLSTGLLSVKFAILSRIGMIDWIPSHHSSAISVGLAKLIYRIGTGMDVDFGSFVFDQTLKHAGTRATKLPISFPSLLSDIILKQHPDILKDCDVPFPRGVPITLDNRLFHTPHVLDIVLPSCRTSVQPSLTVSGSRSTIGELEDLSRELEDVINVTSARKAKVDLLICKLKEEGAPAVSNKDVAEESKSDPGSSADVDVDVDEDSEHASEDEDAGKSGSGSV